VSSDFKNRKQLRLSGYDYSQNGVYFVTMCTQNRECIFGDVFDGKMVLNDAGKMIHDVWNEIPLFYLGIELGAFVVMPNHIHGIIEIVGAAPRGRPIIVKKIFIDIGRRFARDGQPQGVAPTGNQLSLFDIVHRFKTLTTKKYIDGVRNHFWPPFERRIWQRGFHERIIRNDDEYARICEYIHCNPENWQEDEENSDKGFDINR
jgi:REP element-mobilizing transposase RayT